MGNKAETELDSIRLDKWLWAARFFKTRTLSQDNIELGRVKVNKARAKASKEVRVGDELEIFRGSERFIVIVKALSGKRGPAPVAATLYEETEESKFKREQIKEAAALIPVPGADHKGARLSVKVENSASFSIISIRPMIFDRGISISTT